MALRRTLPVLIAVIVGGLYATLSVLRFARFAVVSWDNAIFEQAVKSYAHGHAPIADVKGPGFNLFGDHFSPVLVVLAPIYRAVPAAQTILIAQCVLITISVWVIARLAIAKLNPLYGTVIAVCYGLSFGLQSAIDADFHAIAFAVPLIALAGAAYVHGDIAKVIAWSLPLLLVKENMGVTIAAIGVVLWLTGHRRRGYLLAAIGLVATVAVVWVLIPAVNQASQYDYEIGSGMLTGSAGPKAVTLALTFGITGFLALRSPWALVAIPTFVWRFIGDVPEYWSIEYHYSAVLMPIVFIAMIDAMSKTSRSAWLVWWVRAGTPIALACVLAMASNSPLWFITQSSSWRPNAREIAAEQTIDQIPDGASIETDIGIMTHVVTDHTVYWIGSIDDVRPDYVLLEAGQYGSPGNAAEYAADTHGGDWDVIPSPTPFQLVARK